MSPSASCVVHFFDLSSPLVIFSAFSAIVDKLLFVAELKTFICR